MTTPHITNDSTAEDIDLNTETIYVDGERLTVERADHIAADMLEEARRRNLRPGGKSLSGEGKHSPVVQVRVSQATQIKLKALADARRMSVSKLSRQVLDDFVQREIS